jgi:ATP-binding cassette subfamily F protein uup
MNPDAPDGRWIEYAGGYSDMLEQRKGVADELRRAAKAEKARAGGGSNGGQGGNKGKTKMSFKQTYALENIPKEIAKAEAEIAAREQKMADPKLFSKDPATFNSLAKEVEKLRGKVTKMEEEWLELETLREQMGA